MSQDEKDRLKRAALQVHRDGKPVLLRTHLTPEQVDEVAREMMEESQKKGVKEKKK